MSDGKGLTSRPEIKPFASLQGNIRTAGHVGKVGVKRLHSMAEIQIGFVTNHESSFSHKACLEAPLENVHDHCLTVTPSHGAYQSFRPFSAVYTRLTAMKIELSRWPIQFSLHIKSHFQKPSQNPHSAVLTFCVHPSVPVLA